MSDTICVCLYEFMIICLCMCLYFYICKITKYVPYLMLTCCPMGKPKILSGLSRANLSVRVLWLAWIFSTSFRSFQISGFRVTAHKKRIHSCHLELHKSSVCLKRCFFFLLFLSHFFPDEERVTLSYRRSERRGVAVQNVKVDQDARL